jgi:cysteinyl-tRNA synthetase
LIDQRIVARQEKDWVKSDELRDRIKALGFEVQDK